MPGQTAVTVIRTDQVDTMVQCDTIDARPRAERAFAARIGAELVPLPAGPNMCAGPARFVVMRMVLPGHAVANGSLYHSNSHALTAPARAAQRAAIVNPLLRKRAPSVATSSPGCRPSRIW